MFNRVMNRIKNLFAIGEVTGVDTKVLQIKTSTGKTNDRVKRLHNYGFMSRPNMGARSYLLFLGGVRSRGVSFCVEDERYEMELEKGEVAMLDDKGNLVHFTKNGISITSLGSVEVNAKKDVMVTAEGKAIVTAEMVELNGSDGGVVRDCDTCSFSGSPHTVASKKVVAG